MMPPNAAGDKDMRRAAGPAHANIKPARIDVSINVRTAAPLGLGCEKDIAPIRVRRRIM